MILTNAKWTTDNENLVPPINPMRKLGKPKLNVFVNYTKMCNTFYFTKRSFTCSQSNQTFSSTRPS